MPESASRSKSEILRQELRESILRSPVGSKIPSVRELAKTHEVCHATAVAALNALKKEGLIVSYHGAGSYVADRKARGRKSGEKPLVRLLIHDYPSRFCSMLKDSMAGVCAEEELDLKIELFDHQRRFDEIKLEMEADALVFSPSQLPFRTLELANIRALKIPALCLGVALSDLDFDSVSADDRHGGALAAFHLLGLGHRKLAAVAGEPAGKSPICERIEGFLSEASFHGVEPVVIDCGTKHGEAPFEKAYAKILELAKKGALDFSALFIDTDSAALGAIKALSDLGMKVPRDVSVIGFDGIPEGAFYRPSLSTLSQDIGAWAKASVEILKKRLSGDAQGPIRAKIRPSLLARESTGKPRAI